MVDQIQQIQDALRTPFWHQPDFWINSLLGLLGLLVGAVGVYFAIKAFTQATAAKEAAIRAGNFMTMQTVAIELMAISQRLTNNLHPQMKYREGRSLLDEVTGKLHRVTAPFLNMPDLGAVIGQIHDSLTSAKTALSGVRPNPGADETPGETYNAIESEIATLNLYVNDLLGLLETKSHQQVAD